jgi:streptogrisin C
MLPVSSKAQAVSQDTERTEARMLSDQASIPFGQALKVLRSQRGASDAVAALRTEFKGRLSGIVLDQTAEPKLVVRLKGGAIPPRRLSRITGGDIEIEFRNDATSTIDEQLSSIDAKLLELQRLIPTLQGVGTDERTGDIVLQFAGDEPMGRGIAGKRDDLIRLLGSNVRLERQENATIDANLAAGTRISASGAGVGTATGPCTTGFSITNGTIRAVTTSAHCGGMDTYNAPSGTTSSLRFLSEIHDNDQDIEWLSSTSPVVGEMFSNSSSIPVFVSGQRARSATLAGSRVCHRGTTTGYSCGWVDITNYRPTYAGACLSMTCSPVWVTVKGDATTACAPGDSGGPVFDGQTALGWLKGTNSTGTVAGKCGFFIYMSVDFIPQGFRLVLGSSN